MYDAFIFYSEIFSQSKIVAINVILRVELVKLSFEIIYSVSLWFWDQLNQWITT